MKIKSILKKAKAESPAPAPEPATPTQFQRFGIWGRVKGLRSKDNTVDVILENGISLKHVPVASKEWVRSGEDAEKDFNSGERDLPPLHTRVFVMMPTFTYYDCFVAPFSGFSTIEQTTPYMEDEKEEKKERITPSGWHITNDHVTGSHKAVSPDKKTSLDIDYGDEEEPKKDAPELHLKLFENIKVDVVAEDEVKVDVFDNELHFEHTKGDSVKITVYDTEITIRNGDVQVKTTKQTITTQDIDINSTAPIGLNAGLYSTGLAPYLTAETAAHTALLSAVVSATAQLAILDGLSGGAGTITALKTALEAFCSAIPTADIAAHTAIALAVK